MEPDAAPKALPNGRKERENDREHGIGNLLRQRQKFNGISQYGVFGRDTLATPAKPRQETGTDAASAHQKIHGNVTETIPSSSETIPEMLSKSEGDLSITGDHLAGLEVRSFDPNHPSPDPLAGLERMACLSDLVVSGTALTATSHLTNDQRFLYTDWSIKVETVIKQNRLAPVVLGDAIVVTRPGGRMTLNGRTVRAVELSFKDFATGQKYLLFLKFIPETGSYRATAEKSFRLAGTVEGLNDASPPHLPTKDPSALVQDAITAAALSVDSSCAGRSAP